MSDKIDYRIRGYRQVGPTYVAPDGSSRTIYKFNKYSGRLNANAEDALNNAKEEYKRKSLASDIKSMKLRRYGDKQKALAVSEANRILRDMKNPSAKDLVEFYFDTTVEKAKKSASKAVKKAKKYATKAMSTAEKSVNKAKRYATKTINSIIR